LQNKIMSGRLIWNRFCRCIEGYASNKTLFGSLISFQELGAESRKTGLMMLASSSRATWTTAITLSRKRREDEEVKNVGGMGFRKTMLMCS